MDLVNHKIQIYGSNNIIKEITESLGISVENAYGMVVQYHLDSIAVQFGYTNIDTMVGYENSTIEQWAKEGKSAKVWRDSVWVTAYTVFSKVKSGDIVQPSAEGLLAMLPIFQIIGDQNG